MGGLAHSAGKRSGEFGGKITGARRAGQLNDMNERPGSGT